MLYGYYMLALIEESERAVNERASGCGRGTVGVDVNQKSHVAGSLKSRKRIRENQSLASAPRDKNKLVFYLLGKS